MTQDPDRDDRSRSSGWRWSDDIMAFRVKFVAGMALVALVVALLYLLLHR